MTDSSQASASFSEEHVRSQAQRQWSRRELLARAAGGLVAGSLLAACARAERPPPPTGTPAPTGTPTRAALTPAPATLPAAPTDAPAAATPAPAVAPPTLEQMLGQMIMVGMRGTAVTQGAPIVADVGGRGVGSVVLFSYDVVLQSPTRNVESPAQVAQLTEGLQALAATHLLIAADQEGGRVARLDETHGFAPTIGAQALGDRNDPAFTYAQAVTLAQTLAAAGINHNLAPVVDLNRNPQNPVIGALGRSFSADPAVVVAQARAFITAHHAQGVTTTLKHFPGHGSSAADSHLGLVDVSATWQADELEPYRVLMGEGLADAIMTAHVFNTQLDGVYPATLSPRTIRGILREELGYDGVVITDDMNMGAITQAYGFDQAAVLAVQAGADILAYGNNLVYDPDAAAKAIAALEGAVARGELTVARIEESYRRVAALKERQGTLQTSLRKS